MRRPALLFGLSLIVPSLVLAWLGIRSAREQEVLIEDRTAALYQQTTDELATRAVSLIGGVERLFSDKVERMLLERDVRALTTSFDEEIRGEWPRVRVGFSVTLQGEILSPRASPALRAEAAEFLASSGPFLSSRMTDVFFPVQQALLVPGGKDGPPSRTVPQQALTRNVTPQLDSPDAGATAQLSRSRVPFSILTSEAASGTLTRFAGGSLQVLFWRRPSGLPTVVLGVMLTPQDLQDLFGTLDDLRSRDLDGNCLALLDERGRPVWRSRPGFRTNWKQPFVATEVGEALPLWEAALYLEDPGWSRREARSVHRTTLFVVLLAVTAILAGGLIILIDTRRQMLAVRRRSDFVSNVSHELKSPLTSIRMFSDLLARNPAPGEDRRSRYLQIIRSESERLGRLIDSVLDFARIERGEKMLETRALDAHPLIRETWRTAELSLREEGFTTSWEEAPGPYRVVADEGAISRILHNLLSNARKYSTGRKEIVLRTRLEAGHLQVEVLDRGPGVPPRMRERVFEPFFRGDESLSSGVTGTGLGLSLARSLAEACGGSLGYEPRPEGGSLFRLVLPLQESPTDA